MNKNGIILSALKSETGETIGCTDPGGVAYAAALAAKTLGTTPNSLNVVVSRNIFKNGNSVGLPNTKERGLKFAATLGCLLPEKTHKKLSLLEYVNKEIISQAKTIIEKDNIILSLIDNPIDSLYIDITAFSGNDSVRVKLCGDYTNVAEIIHNKKIIFRKSYEKSNNHKTSKLLKHSPQDLIENIINMDLSDLKFLLEYANINKNTALVSLNSKTSGSKLANYYFNHINNFNLPYSAIMLAKFYTSAAAELRMTGKSLPVIAVAGSGNHGITCFLGALAAAESLKVNQTKTVKALAISVLLTIYIKGFINKMTAFCGCAVAASTGVAAATVYLLKGNFNQMVLAINSLVSRLAGLICDGAKESCAYKISTAAATSIECGYLAYKQSIGVPAGMGIVGDSLVETFKNLGKLNNPGMLETDKCLVSLI